MDRVKDGIVFIYNLAIVIFPEEIATIILTSLGLVESINEIAKMIVIVSTALFGILFYYLRYRSKKIKNNKEAIELCNEKLDLLYRTKNQLSKEEYENSVREILNNIKDAK